MTVRPARLADAEDVARLLYESAPLAYDGLAGPAALEVLRRAFRRRGNNASREAVTVAVVDGAVAGVMAAFPATEAAARAAMFTRLTLAHTPPWHWPRTLRADRAASASSPVPPPASLYVDALAVVPALRRRGVASALLDAASRQAAARGLGCVALDTALTNDAARRLYERAGCAETTRADPQPPLPAAVGYARAVPTR